MITIDNYIIYDAGDESVGIWSQTFTVRGPFYFESAEEKYAFEKELLNVFGMVCQCAPSIVQDMDEHMECEIAEHDARHKYREWQKAMCNLDKAVVQKMRTKCEPDN